MTTIEWSKVTWYSKLAALVIFVGTFFVAFALGRQYEVTRINGLFAEQEAEQIIEETQQAQKNDIINDVNFACAGDTSIHAVFRKSRKVDLGLSDGRSMTLPQAISASGARYANADESFVFWNKGDTAFVDENGKRTYTDCTIKPSGQGVVLPPPQAFARTGVVIADNPGLPKQNTPYLSYELPGKPALTVELQFNDQSICGTTKDTIACMAMNAWPPLRDRRVQVSGVEANGVVIVGRLIAVD